MALGEPTRGGPSATRTPERPADYAPISQARRAPTDFVCATSAHRHVRGFTLGGKSGCCDSATCESIASAAAHTEHVLRWARFGFVVLVAAPLLSACDADPSGSDGDCNARIRYRGVAYRPHKP